MNASFVAYDEDDNEVLNKTLSELDTYDGVLNADEEKVKGKLCLAHVLFEEGTYGGGESEVDEPLEPEELTIDVTWLDDMVGAADFVVSGITYGENALPYETDLNTDVSQQFLGVAKYNEYVQAEKWLIDLGENLPDEDED